MIKSPLSNSKENLIPGKTLKLILPNPWFSCKPKTKLLQLYHLKNHLQGSLNCLIWQEMLVIILMIVSTSILIKKQIFQIIPIKFLKINTWILRNMETHWLQKRIISKTSSIKKDRLPLQCFFAKINKKTAFTNHLSTKSQIIVVQITKKQEVWSF